VAGQNDYQSSYVDVSLGMTLGLKNYSSARVDVGVRIPCEDTEAARSAAYDAGKAFCSTRVAEELQKIKDYDSGKRGP